MQFLFALLAMLFMLQVSPNGNEQIFILPFNKEYIFVISPFIFLLISIFVIIGSSNAVNLTDGLDGLQFLPSVLIAGGLGSLLTHLET